MRLGVNAVLSRKRPGGSLNARAHPVTLRFIYGAATRVSRVGYLRTSRNSSTERASDCIQSTALLSTTVHFCAFKKDDTVGIDGGYAL